MSERKQVNKSLKLVLALFCFFAILAGCISITNQIVVHADTGNTIDSASADISRMSRCTAAYYGHVLTNPNLNLVSCPDTKYSKAGLFGYMNETIDGDYSFGAVGHDSNNHVIYYTRESGHGNGGLEYSKYGYTLSYLGFDELNTGSGNTLRKLLGDLMIAVYSLSSSLNAFFKYTVSLLKTANPFNLFYGNFSGDGDIVSGLTLIKNVIGSYYETLRQMSMFAILPLLLVIGLAKWLIPPNQTGFSVFRNLKGWFLRFMFVIVGIPICFALYDTVLSMVDGALTAGESNRMIASTFVDFESFVENKGLSDAGLPLGTIDAAGELSDEGFYNVRNTCGIINNVGGGVGGGTGAMAAVTEQYDLRSGSAGSIDILSLLQRYANGDVVQAGKYAASMSKKISDEIKASGGDGSPMVNMIIDSNHWEDFAPEKVAQASAEEKPDRKGQGGTDLTNSQLEGNAAARFTGSPWGGGYNPWLASGSSFSDMGVYNYLCSEFKTPFAVTVYSSEASTSASKPQHYSVNLVGTAVTKWVYYADALILLGATTILGYLFCIGVIVSNFKAMFQLIPAVFSAFIGSMKGIANVLILTGGLIMSVVFTFGLYGLVGVIMDVIYFLLEKPVASLISTIPGLPGKMLYIAMLILSMVFVCGVVKKALEYRKAIISAATNGVTELVNKLLGTNASTPDLHGKSGALMTAATTAAGLGLAAANGAFDGTAERLGIKDDLDKASSDAKKDISNTMANNDSSNNPFNVTEDANADSTDKSLTEGDDSTLKNEDGDTFKDGDGNDLKVDDEGNLTDKDGNQLYDKDGNPINERDLVEGEDGSLLNKKTGEPVEAFDKDGNEVGGFAASDTLSAGDEDSGLKDADGNEITDQYGGKYGFDENGELVDSKGRHVYDSYGGRVRKGANGKLVDSKGKAVKMKNGKFSDSQGKSLQATDGKELSAGKSVQNDGTGKAVTDTGEAITGADGQQLGFNEKGELVGSDGKPVSDGMGGTYKLDPKTGKLVDSHGNAAKVDGQGRLMSGDGKRVSDTKGDIGSSGKRAAGVNKNGISEKAEANVRSDSSGKAVSGSGEAIRGSDGQQLGFNEKGELVGADGNVIKDDNGNAYSLDSDGNLVDGDGNAVTVSDDGHLQDASGDFISDDGGDLSADIPDDVDTDYLTADDSGSISTSNDESIDAANGSEMHIDPSTGELKDSAGNTIKDDFGKAYHKDAATGHIVDSNGNALKIHSDGSISSAGSAAIAGAAFGSAGAKSAFKANVNTERSGNSFSNADSFVKNNNKDFNRSGKTSDNTVGSVNSRDNTFNPAAKGIKKNRDGTYTLPNGDTVNSVSLGDEKAESGIITESGDYMSMSDAVANGVDGTECVKIGDNIVMGHLTDDNSVVLGMETADGGFESGMMVNGQFVHGGVVNNQFVRGRTTSSGDVESGYYGSDGFHKGEWDANGQFHQTGLDANDVPPALGMTASAGSVSIGNDGSITMNGGPGSASGSTSSGDSAAKFDMYTNKSTGDAAVDIGSDGLISYAADNSGIKFKPSGEGGGLRYYSTEGQSYLGGAKVSSYVDPGTGKSRLGFVGNGGDIIPIESSNGGAGVGDNNGGIIGLSSDESGNMYMDAGDGRKIAVTSAGGALSMRTQSGRNVPLYKGSNNGFAVMDVDGDLHDITVHDGYLAIGNGNDTYTALTADADGDAMIGSGGKGVYVAAANGALGVDAGTTYVGSDSGSGMTRLSSSGSGAVAIGFDEGSGKMFANAGGQTVDLSSSSLGYSSSGANNVQVVSTEIPAGTVGTNASKSVDTGFGNFTRATTATAGGNPTIRRTFAQSGSNNAPSIQYADSQTIGSIGMPDTADGTNAVILNNNTGDSPEIMNVIAAGFAAGTVAGRSATQTIINGGGRGGIRQTDYITTETVSFVGGGNGSVDYSSSGGSGGGTVIHNTNTVISSAGSVVSNVAQDSINGNSGSSTVQSHSTSTWNHGSGTSSVSSYSGGSGSGPVLSSTMKTVTIGGNSYIDGTKESGYNYFNVSPDNSVNAVMDTTPPMIVNAGSTSGNLEGFQVVTKAYSKGSFEGVQPVYSAGSDVPTAEWFADNPGYMPDAKAQGGYRRVPGLGNARPLTKVMTAESLAGKPPIYEIGSNVPTKEWLMANGCVESYTSKGGYAIDMNSISSGSLLSSELFARSQAFNLSGGDVRDVTKSAAVDAYNKPKSERKTKTLDK